MTPEDTELLAQYHDRTAIQDCLYRYCRGVDRADEAAVRSAYWPGARDRHGPYSGPVEGFIDWARTIWATGPRNVHVVTNILIEFRGPTQAAVESYFTAFQRMTGSDGVTRQMQLVGRYCDLFEKRGAEWRIAERTVVYDWCEDQPVPDGTEAERFGVRQPIGGMWPDDPVYHIGNTPE